MNEIRKELERQFIAHGLLKPKAAGNVGAKNSQRPDAMPETSPDDEDKVVIHIEAPAGYAPEFAEDFKNLTPKWQEYLGKREKETAGRLEEFANKIAGYKWLDDIYANSKERLDNEGVASARDWLSGLAYIDEKMGSNPLETLLCLAKFYGIDLNSGKSCGPADRSGEILSRISQIERKYGELIAVLAERNAADFENRLKMFGMQTDVYGKPLHPYFFELLPQIRKLLSGGIGGDIEEAYNKALWMNAEIREKLVSQQINLRAAEAQRAKKAAFAPKGKTKAPERELTLREELEKNMAAFCD